VAVVREDWPGEKRLVAYCVPKSGCDFNQMELRAHLERTIPGYMVPSAIVTLAALPLTDNGKIDRRALPAPDWSHVESGGKAAPSDHLEVMLVKTWKRVLGVSNVGVNDNFFDLGGHSLLAVRLLSEVEKVVGRKIPLASLFRGSTVASLAKLLREGSESEPEPLVVEYQAGNGLETPIFAVAAPGVRSIGYVLLGRHLGGNQPFYKLQAQGPMTQERPLSMQESRALARQYIAGMRAVQPEGPYFVAAMCGGCQIAEQMILELENQGQEVGMFAVFDTWVLENIHRRWGWYLFSYSQRLRQMRMVGLREQMNWLTRALRNRIKIWTGKAQASQPWAEAYWPKKFTPARFRAPVVLFKRPKQPYYYIDDPHLGWAERTEGGVEIHEIDAKHHEFLREPHLLFISKILVSRLRPTKGRPEPVSSIGVAS
jgi:thioesterase domain-containing protein/acyl carrier protein